MNPVLSIWQVFDILWCVYGSLRKTQTLGDFLVIRQKAYQTIKGMEKKVQGRLLLVFLTFVCYIPMDLEYQYY